MSEHPTADDTGSPRSAEHRQALLRLRRVHGQLGGVIHMIEQDREPTEVLTQLAAVLHALHRAGFRMVADELERCRDEDGQCNQKATAQLEHLFLALG